MPDDQLKVLWDKYDSHSERLHNYAVEQGVMHAKLNTLETRFDRHQTEIAERHGEMIRLLTEYNGKVDNVINEAHRRQGAKDATRWLVPTVMTILALLIAAGIITGAR